MTHASTSGTGASAAPHALGCELEVEEPRTPSPVLRIHAHRRSTERGGRMPEGAIEAARLLRVAHHRGRALLGEEHAERLDELFLLLAEGEIHRARQRELGVNVAGMRCQPADHRPVGVVDHAVGVDVEVGHAVEHGGDHLRERDAGQVRTRAAVDADPERHVTVGVAVDDERVGVGEFRLVTTGRHLAQQHLVALLHGDAAELGVGRDDALVCARRRIEAQELLGGEREQRGVVDQPLPIGRELARGGAAHHRPARSWCRCRRRW